MFVFYLRLHLYLCACFFCNTLTHTLYLDCQPLSHFSESANADHIIRSEAICDVREHYQSDAAFERACEVLEALTGI